MPSSKQWVTVVARTLAPVVIGWAVAGWHPALLWGGLAGLVGLLLARPYGGLAVGLGLVLALIHQWGAAGIAAVLAMWCIWLPRPHYHLLAAGAFAYAGWGLQHPGCGIAAALAGSGALLQVIQRR